MNKDNSGKPRVALIAGPTASGKSALAIELAEARGGTIINADASQVYRGLPILSAQPSAADQARIPHLLFGTRSPEDVCSAADWAADARAAIKTVLADGRLPILVGGTGLYLQTLVQGIAPVPPIDPAVRAAVRALPQEEAYAALAQEDPPSAARLHPADRLRTTRALEVIRSTGQPLATWQSQRHGGIEAEVDLRALILLPARDELYARCDARFDAMVEHGAIDEVQDFLAKDLSETLPAFRTIGLAEIADHLAGRLTLEAAKADAQRATRQYAKRQYTWFRHQPPAEWHRHAHKPATETLSV